MSKNLTENYPIVDTVEALEERLAGVREAQRIFAAYTQEQVDKIFTAAALAANKARIPLAKLAVEETGMGIVEDKVIKNHYASEYIYNAYRDTKTCGVIEEDKAYGIKKVAEPIGVVAAVIPTTNPTSTAIFKTLISLKTRNGIIISPHPRAKKSTIAAAKVVLEAAVAAGAPDGIIGWIDVPSLELTDTLMKEADIILATGGPGMVKAAYSSGKPALGVGAGNTPAIIDESADVILAVNSIIHSKTFDNGMICASEQSVIVDKKVYKAVKEEFAYRGCYFLNKSETEKVRKTIIINGALNAKIVGQKAHTIAALAGVTVPEETKILIGEVTSVDLSEEFAHEKLSPVLAMYKAEDFEDALSKAEHLIADGGFGHTSSLYINVETQADKIAEFSERMKTCRCLINTPSSHGGIGDLYNFKMAPSLTLGCGSWGGNSVSENVGVKHLLNVKTVAERRENMLWFRAPEKVYFKKGCLPVALDELGTVMGKKKAFIVTDQFLYKNGYTKCVTDKLDSLGIMHTTFYNVAPDPTLACAKEGTAAMRLFEPDVIIAIGGGSAMDAAKIARYIYEYSLEQEPGFLESYEKVSELFTRLQQKFVDIRKRIVKFHHGTHTKLFCIPTTSGTGSEVTPYAVITDDNTHVKYPLTDYEMTPQVAIVDPEFVMTVPKRTVAWSGLDTLSHALESYVSVMASDFTRPWSLQAIKLVFENLEKSYNYDPKNPTLEGETARENMHYAATLGGMAFANAFLGINHSLAHKTGGEFGLPHGLAISIAMQHVIRFNGASGKVKRTPFPRYEVYRAQKDYADIARALGLKGRTDADLVEALCNNIEELMKAVDVTPKLSANGVTKEAFDGALDKLCDLVYNDQCTTANPRQPSLEEIRQLLIDQF